MLVMGAANRFCCIMRTYANNNENGVDDAGENLQPRDDDRHDTGSLMNDVHRCVANDFYEHIISEVTDVDSLQTSLQLVVTVVRFMGSDISEM